MPGEVTCGNFEVKMQKSKVRQNNAADREPGAENIKCLTINHYYREGTDKAGYTLCARYVHAMKILHFNREMV
jgi:hypothetical protein